MTQHWFEDWFDSPYYPVLYKNRDAKEAHAFLDKLLRHLKINKGAHILDLACGRGRHSYYLARKGYFVTGADLSEKSLLSAQNYCLRYSPALYGKRLQYVRKDMRQIIRKNSFNAVLNLFTSFGYFEKDSDNMRVLMSVKSQMKKNGVFILDFLNSDKAEAELKKEEIKTIDGITFRLNRSLHNGFFIKKIQVNGKTFHEKVKSLGQKDFNRYFSKTGMQIVKKFGDYDLSNFDEKNSDRLILVAKKDE